MAGVGPVLDPLSIDAVPDEKAWGVAFEDELVVLIQFDERKNCLVLTSELGAPPPGDRMALYEMLLQINYHWDTTGGNLMGINGPEGDVVQMFEIGADGLDVTRFSGILSSFADTAKGWRDLVRRPAAAKTNSRDLNVHKMWI
jgi:hypothetical protein